VLVNFHSLSVCGDHYIAININCGHCSGDEAIHSDISDVCC